MNVFRQMSPFCLRMTWRKVSLGLFSFFLGVTALQAHKVSSVSLISHLDTKEDTYLLDAAMEVVPSDDDLLNEQIPPEEAAREFAEEYLITMFDEVEQTPELEITIESASDENTPAELQRKQVLVQLTGQIPEGASEFLLYLEPTCPMAVVMVVIKDDKPSRRMQVILPGEYSRPVNVIPVMEGDPFVAGEDSTKAEAASQLEQPDQTVEEESAKESLLRAGWMAFFSTSLLPLALTACLFLMTTQRKPVFVQSAGFMIGMSLTITLAVWKLLETPAWASTVAAALLVAMAGESLLYHRFRPWRYIASVLAGGCSGWLVAGYALPRLGSISAGELSPGQLALFVLGAELALVVAGVLAAAFFLTMGRFDWYRKSVLSPVAVVFVAFGIFKLVEPFL